MQISQSKQLWQSFTKKSIDEWLKYCDEIEETTPITAKEDKKDKQKRIQNLLNDYEAFVDYYFQSVTRGTKCARFHIEAANKIASSKNFKGVFEWARGHAKSTHLSLFIPLWLKAKGEFKTFVLVGQNEPSAKRLLSKIQAHLVKNKRYIQDFGTQTDANTGEWKDGEFSTRDGVKFIAVGRGQSPRGLSSDDSFRPDFIVIDDLDDDELVRNPRRVRETIKWVQEALFGTLDMGRGRFAMVGNRIAKNSVLTSFIEKQGIFHTKINALDEFGEPSWIEKYSIEEIESVRTFQGYFAFQKEYMNNPIEEGNVFQNHWIKWANMPNFEDFEQITAYIDPSFKSSSKNDYKAIAIVGTINTKFYVIDCFVQQCSILSMVSWLYDFEEEIKKKDLYCSYFMEGNFLQDMLLDDFYEEGLRRGVQLGVIADKRSKPDKFARIEGISPNFERGWCVFNEAKKNNQDFTNAIDQILSFEKGSKTHDDFPDALEGAIYILQKNTKQLKEGAYRLGKRTTPEYF